MMTVIKQLIKERVFINKDGKTCTRYGYRGKNTIKYIVVHYTGVPTARGKAKNIASGMLTSTRSVSTHYLVGEDGIFQVVDERNAAWHCGGVSEDNKCDCCNAIALGVDLVEHKRNEKSDSINDKDWYFSKEVLEKGAQLIADLADKYNIPYENIIRHYDVTGKKCPRPFVGKDTNEVTGELGEFAWMVFKLLVDAKRQKVCK